MLAGHTCRTFSLLFILTISSTTWGSATQQLKPNDNMFRQAISDAVLENPNVKAAWHAFNSATAEQRVAKGSYYPSLDLIAETGAERGDQVGLDRDQRTYHRENVSLTLTQLLFDGFATKNEVQRLGFEKQARYYDLKQRSEESANNAASAYINVVRRQKLLEFAKENFVFHQVLFDDIEKRVKAGISRRVDLEQANARLALAEINMLTEANNLYDQQVIYQSVVGQLPGDHLAKPLVPFNDIPNTYEGVVALAYQSSPQLRSALQSVHAAQAQFDGTKGNYWPRLDLRVRHNQEKNIEGVVGVEDETAVELVMSYNIFRGGADSARRKQAYSNRDAATESRLGVCRDVRQTVLTAYNRVQNIQQQLAHLQTNELAISRARTAYKKQFNIGQRSLLDLLDTENEYFDVRRARANADYDLVQAQVETLSRIGILLSTLQISSIDGSQSTAPDSEQSGYLIAQACQQDTPMPTLIDRQALLEEVIRAKSEK